MGRSTIRWRQFPGAPWVPEYFGNLVLVNGKLLPYLEVQPRKYRFRVLNASNGRFYFLSLDNGAAFRQIGTDQGLLPGARGGDQLAIAPGERADIVVDFAEHRGAEHSAEGSRRRAHAVPRGAEHA